MINDNVLRKEDIERALQLIKCKKCNTLIDSYIVIGFTSPMCKCKSERACKTKAAKEASKRIKQLLF